MSSIVIQKKWLVISVSTVIFILSLVLFGTAPSADKVDNKPISQVSVDGTIYVKGGYTPREIVLPANKEVVLRFVTKNTYDCSASLLIPELDVEKFLLPTGTTDVIIAPQQSGKKIIAGCSMGMYNFAIKFQ